VTAHARQVLAHHSKSFALAGKLLPRDCRDDAAVVYAWCRRADDAIDLAPPEAHAAALATLRRELDDVYAQGEIADPELAAFQQVVRRRRIPRRYPQELIEGLQMDVDGRRYATVDELLLYCFRMAGTVGLMMCHLFDVRHAAVLRRANDMGMAMQLTNVCRDVAEDWAAGRLYLPQELVGASLDPARASAAARVLLARAAELYRSGDRGVDALPFRAAVAVRTARLVYSAIGDVIAARGYDVLAGRAVVSHARKIVLAARAFATTLVTWPVRRLTWRKRTRGSAPALPFALPLEEV
jgi:15-cis-phytoene synthase